MDPPIATNMLLNGLTLDIGIIDIGLLSAHLCWMKYKVPEIHLPLVLVFAVFWTTSGAQC